jgi:dolichyl-phosphate beta-glucosyltransferase
MPRTSLVVPCYNEAQRLNVAAYQQFARSGTADLILVDDGSKDDTLSVLNEIRSLAPDRVSVLALSPNRGRPVANSVGLIDTTPR